MHSQKQSHTEETVADDALHGVKAIADYLGLEDRQAFYAIKRGYLPVSHIGRKIVAFRSVLTRHLRPEAAAVASPAPTVTRTSVERPCMSGSRHLLRLTGKRHLRILPIC